MMGDRKLDVPEWQFNAATCVHAGDLVTGDALLAKPQPNFMIR
jgi:hypothetical protein